MLKNLTISRFLSDYCMNMFFMWNYGRTVCCKLNLSRIFPAWIHTCFFQYLLYTKHLARMEQSLVNVHMLLHATRIVMLPCVEAHMRLQTSALFESFFADDTWKMFSRNMTLSMIFQFTIREKPFAANVTRETFITSVNPHMIIPGFAVCKSFLAHWTFETFCTHMALHMCL